MMGWYDFDHMSGWDWVGMTVSSVLVLGLLLLAAVLLVRQGSRPRNDWSATSSQSAEQVLAERFARGEIDEDEYRRRLAALRDADTAGR